MKEEYKRYVKKCGVKGSAVVEMSYIMPVILLLTVMVIHAVFYYHDKAVLNGAASETAVLGAQMERRQRTMEYDLEEFFRERIEGKLIFMTDTVVSAEKSDREVSVEVSASKGRMKLKIRQKAVIARPEEKIRWMK